MTFDSRRLNHAILTVDSVLDRKNDRESGNHFGDASPERCAAAKNPREKLV